MKRYFILLSLLLTSCSTCEDVFLSKTCPQINQQCFVLNDNMIVGNNIKLTGECEAGIVVCDDDGKTICEGFIGPQKEMCDQKDNDCDGLIDEDFDYDKDMFSTCNGDCDDNNELINPSVVETCNGKDDNCNGQIDENIFRECFNGSVDAIFSSTSQCKKGTQKCLNGSWDTCLGSIGADEYETCDGIDNDCDGEVDEIEQGICGPLNNIGACTLGDQICSKEGDLTYESYCLGAVYSSEEICDNIDNNCDGQIDENVKKYCETDCGSGNQICHFGVWEQCSAPQPSIEVCDGIDNDCDGEVDEDCECNQGDIRTCIENIVDQSRNPVDCGVGFQLCDEKNEWGDCSFISPQPELCNNWDDDCDGEIDFIVDLCGNESLAGIGECQLGTSTCSAGIWSECEGSIEPEIEICDQKDNDCDGETDEDLNPTEKADVLFVIDNSCSMVGIRNTVQLGIAQFAQDFENTEHQFGLVIFPGPGVGAGATTYDVITTPALTDIVSFQSSLLGVTQISSGTERAYDTLYDLLRSIDVAGIQWRPDAHPYIILITDEPVFSVATEIEVANLTTNCQSGGCPGTGNQVEIFIITQGSNFNFWDSITFNDPNRLIEIYPASDSRYADELRNKVFANICI